MQNFSNKEINLRFEDWLLNPVESPDLEVKDWIDPGNREAQGTIAKALIALENHGGGFLVIGFTDAVDGILRPGLGRPETLDAFGTDQINAIVSRFADPPFHVHVSQQKSPVDGQTYPVIRTPGTSKIPVRSKSATQASIKDNVYYIRRPGPCSDLPRDGIEWDALIRRCVLNQRAEIVEMLRNFMPNAERQDPSQGQEASDTNAFTTFCLDSFTRWQSINQALNDEDPSKIKLGYFIFACEIHTVTQQRSQQEILTAIEGLRRYTGWPILTVLHQADAKPYPYHEFIEASYTKLRHRDPAHADFWRVDPSGKIYFLRGYQEDCLELLAETKKVRSPGSGIDLTVPVWRVGEFLLRCSELARFMVGNEFTLSVQCEWHGLKERELFMFNPRRMLFDGHRCTVDTVKTRSVFAHDVLSDLLPDAVRALTAKLYSSFDFLDLPNKFYEEEIEYLRTGRIG